MDLSFETIDALRQVVGKISTDIFAKLPVKPEQHYRHKGKGRIKYYDNNFADDPLNGRMPNYNFVDNGNCLRIFCGSASAFFDLRDVRVREVKDIVYESPTLIDKDINPVHVKTWRNNSDTTETHKLSAKKASLKSETRTTDTGFALEIIQSLQTKIGGGLKGIADAEVQTGLQIKTNFDHRFGTSKTSEESEEASEEQTYKVPPRTKTTLLREEGVSNYEQRVKMTGVLDASLWISSQDDFGFPVNSFVDLQRIIRGGSADGVDWHVSNCFKSRQYQNYEIDFTLLHMTVEKVLPYRDVQSSEIDRTDTPL